MPSFTPRKSTANRPVSAPRATSNPDVKTYTLRKIDPRSWESFKNVLNEQGHTVVWALNQLIERVGNGEVKLR